MALGAAGSHSARAASRRHVAFLRGVSPVNADMATLRRCAEAAGFANVKSVLASGNIVFDASAATEAALAQTFEEAQSEHLGRRFATIVRRADALRALVAADPFAAYRLPPDAKRVVTFLRTPPPESVKLPSVRDGVRMLALRDTELLTVYVPNPKGPVFMTMIERLLGADVTTRTWDTVRKCAAA